jgi:hypothetical protein
MVWHTLPLAACRKTNCSLSTGWLFLCERDTISEPHTAVHLHREHVALDVVEQAQVGSGVPHHVGLRVEIAFQPVKRLQVGTVTRPAANRLTPSTLHSDSYRWSSPRVARVCLEQDTQIVVRPSGMSNFASSVLPSFTTCMRGKHPSSAHPRKPPHTNTV